MKRKFMQRMDVKTKGFPTLFGQSAIECICSVAHYIIIGVPGDGNEGKCLLNLVICFL